MADVCSGAFKTAQLLDPVDPINKAHLVHEILCAWRTVDNGAVGQTSKICIKYWEHWKHYTAQYNRNAYLSNTTKLEQHVITTAFAVQVRTGYYQKGTQIKVPSICEAMTAISNTIKLAGECSPIYKVPGNISSHWSDTSRASAVMTHHPSPN
eukprot:5973501-Ditylum_brightwellii.AAC.1